MDYMKKSRKISASGRKRENGILKDDKLSKSHSFAGPSGDPMELQDLVNRLMQDKTRLQQRLEQSLGNERELVLELERLRRRIGESDTNGRRTSPSPVRNSLERFLRRVEEDRDYWKQEATLLAQMVVKNNRGGESLNVSSIGDRGRSRVEPVQHVSSIKPDKIWERKLFLVQEELKHYKNENDRLKRERNRSLSPIGRGRSLSHGRSPPTRERNFLDESKNTDEVQRLRNERDGLQKMLDRFERQLQEIQSNARIVTQERDRLTTFQEESHCEIQRLRQELLTAVSSLRPSANNSSSPPPAVQHLLKRLQCEKDEAVGELRRLTTERDMMRERLRVATERDLAERARLEQTMEDLQTQLRRTLTEKEDANLRCQQLRQQCAKVESESESLRKQLLERGLQQNSERDALKDVQSQLETSQRHETELRRDLHKLESALMESGDRARILEERIHILEKEVKTSREEGSRMRTLAHQLEAQKETLQGTLEDRVQKVRALEKEMNARDQSLLEMKTTFQELEKQLSRERELMDQRERETKSLKKQVEHLHSGLEQEVRRWEQAKKENTRLLTDYENVKSERDSIFSELQEALEEREDLREQLKEYLVQVQRVENLLSEKEDERSRLVEQLKLLSTEGDRCQLEIRRLEDQIGKIRLEIATREEEIDTMRLRWEQSQVDLSDAREINAQQASEMSTLSRSLEELELRLKQNELQQQEWLRDMNALRELCSRLENSKDTLQRQLNSTQLDCEQFQVQVKEMSQETELLREQVLTEQDNVHKLEGLLAKARDQQFQSQMEVQESSTELNMLKDRLEIQEAKADHQQRELTRLRARNTELETNMDRVNRQLTTEKFEKERILQDLRRSQQQIIQMDSGIGTTDKYLSLDVPSS